VIAHVRDVTIDWTFCDFRKPESRVVPNMDKIMAMILLKMSVLVFYWQKNGILLKFPIR